MSKNTIRKIGNKEIYNSYMGILRISPDENLNDDITDKLSSTNKEIKVSDSNGNPLSLAFKPQTHTIDGFNSSSINVFLMESRTHFYSIAKSLNVRNFLIIDNRKLTSDEGEASSQSYFNYVDNNNGTESSKRKSSLVVNNTKEDNNELVVYPIESPYDKNCFLNKSDLNLTISGTINENRYKNLNNTLKNKNKTWYDANIPEKYWRKINDIPIYQKANNGDKVPLLVMKNYVLGHYPGHNSSDIGNQENDRNETLKEIVNYSTLSDLNLKEPTAITKLSWIDIEDVIWSKIEKIIRGNYATVQPGLIIYNAIPLRRLLFHTKRNIKSGNKSFVNSLTTNFKICDGSKNINLKLDDNINIKNMPELLSFGELKDSNKIYSSNRYIRGLNWIKKDNNSILEANTNLFKGFNGYPTKWAKQKNITTASFHNASYSTACRTKTYKHTHYMFLNQSAYQGNTKIYGYSDAEIKDSLENKVAGFNAVYYNNNQHRMLHKGIPIFEQYRQEKYSKTNSTDNFHGTVFPDPNPGNNNGYIDFDNPLYGINFINLNTSNWLAYCFSTNKAYNSNRLYFPVKTAAFFINKDDKNLLPNSFKMENGTNEIFYKNDLNGNKLSDEKLKKLKRLNEAEGRVPFTINGGAPYDFEVGYFKWRRRSREIRNLFSRGYGYSLKVSSSDEFTNINDDGTTTKSKFNHSNDVNDYIYRCVSSLPRDNQDLLGQEINQTVTEKSTNQNKIGFANKNSLIYYKNSPNPPSINLIPLLRV